MSAGGLACAACLAPGLGLGLGLAAGWGRGMAVGLGCCLAVGLGGGWVLGSGAAAGLGFGWAAGAGFAGVRCRPALPVAGRGAVGALAAAAVPTAGMGFGARVGGVARGLGGGVPGEGVVVEVDEVVVVVQVVDSEAEETDVGDAGAGCWVLWARRVRVRVRVSDGCARFPWCPVCVQVPVPWVVSCVVCGVVVELSWMRGLVSYRGGGGPHELQDVWV